MKDTNVTPILRLHKTLKEAEGLHAKRTVLVFVEANFASPWKLLPKLEQIPQLRLAKIASPEPQHLPLIPAASSGTRLTRFELQPKVI
jgi:hypothetical protein